MARNGLQLRRSKYCELSSQIALIDNPGLFDLLGKRESGGGWARNHTIDVGKSRVFIKRLLVTDIEYENLYSTRNLYDLPTYYNYGVGSAGFGVFRELVTHVKTTNWVLDGAIDTFPLMYHYRYMPRSEAGSAPDSERHRGYVEYWGGNENIGRYILDRASARYELVLFLEYVPYVLADWLVENSDRTHRVLEHLRATITFLRKHGVIHFDAHYGNVLTDGERPYLTDFGLVLDKSFTLSTDEVEFFQRHIYYDYGEVIWWLGFIAEGAYESLSEGDKALLSQKYGIAEGASDSARLAILLDNMDQIHAEGILRLGKSYTHSVAKYRKIIAEMAGFYSALRSSREKNTRYPHAKMRRLLKECEFD